MSIIFPTKADVVAAITNQEVGLALTVATQLNQMMTDSPLTCLTKFQSSVEMLICSNQHSNNMKKLLCLKDGLLFIQKFIGQKVILLFL